MGDTFAIIELLRNCERVSDIIDVPDSDGYTALHLACVNDNLSAVKALVEYGHANVQAVGDWGYSPLHLYARWSHATKIVSWCAELSLEFCFRQKQDRDEDQDSDKIDRLLEVLQKLTGDSITPHI